MSQKMHVNIYSKVMTFNLKAMPLAIASALVFSGSAYAAGLGKLTVLSSLGQPLHAEIELTSVSKEEAGTLNVKLASVEAFRQANIEFNPALFSLRFAVEQRGAGQVVRVTSTQPMNEPFVDMLLELGGTNNRLVREFTFLLDPAELRKSQPVQLASPATPKGAAAAANRRPTVQSQAQSQAQARTESVAEPAPAEKSPNSQSAAPANQANARKPSAAAEPTNQQSQAASADGEQYRTRQGDTLARIASQHRLEGVSLDQMLVALHQANPDAFVGNNINRLRAGQILSIPSSATAGSVAPAEARKFVVAQAADFNAYRAKLAAQIGNASPQKAEEAKQSATGKITAQVEEPSGPANEAKDKLKLSKSGAAAVAGADKASGLPAGTEDKIAKDKAVADANARVKELERNVNDLQKLLEVKNKDLASSQQQAEAPKADAAKLPAAAPSAAAAAPAAPTANPDQPAQSSAAESAAAAATGTQTPVPAEQTAAPAAPSAETVQPEQAPVAAAPTKPAPKKPVAPPPPEPSFVDMLLEDPTLLGLGAGAIVLLGGAGIFLSRRRRQAPVFEDSGVLDESSLKANSLFASTGGQSVDTSNNSVFNSSFAPSASQLDTNEVDPVAEADVYIAYGRDAQAEEILKEALRTQPERNAVRVKLLEIYAQRKDARAFESMASELYSLTKGKGEDWTQAVNMGIAIDPKNPLYAGGNASESPVGGQDKMDPTTEQLDELDLAALLNTTRGAEAAQDEDALDPGTSYVMPASETKETDVNADTADLLDAVRVSPEDDKQDDNLLQFNNEPAAELKAEAAAGPVSSLEAPEAPAALDFDFDLAGFGKDKPSMEAATESEPADESDLLSNGMDFDFQLDKPVMVDLDEAELLSGSSLSDRDIERDKLDFASLDIDLPGLDNDDKAAPAFASPAAAAPAEFDLSGINLDLDSPDTDTAVMPPEVQMEESDSSNAAEMATKLDLALAYQEIGDKDGARELLDEVVNGGTDEQVQKAKAMLQKLA